MKTSNGGPAFPIASVDMEPVHPTAQTYDQLQGMSLRDWFAGMALAGIKWQGYERIDDSAKVCYRMADAMLAERDKNV